MFNINPNAVYTITTLASEADVCYNTVAAWVKAGLKAKKLGNNTYITGTSILEFFGKETEEKEPEMSDKLRRRLQKIL